MKIKDKVLVVEDDKNIRSFLQAILEANNYEVILTQTGQEAYSLITSQCPDVILLDLGLPDMDGMKILETVRGWSAMPIIVVSARDRERDKVEALDKGADDYMSKPFSILELMARVKTNLRRANLYVTNAGGFTVDNNTYKILYKGEDLKLTLKEFKLFKILIGQAGITVNREALFREVWGEDYMGETRTLDMHMATLRDKIKNAGGSGDCIVTVRGIGYRFENI